MSLEAILARLELDLRALQREATEIRRLALKSEPKFYMSLYALLMAAFSQVDLLSALAAGELPGNTNNLRRFLREFSSFDGKAIDQAIQLYRHTLMHTGRPRELLNRRTGQRQYFLLHWGKEHADPSVHFTVDGDGKLTLNLESLLEDLLRVFCRFAEQARLDTSVGTRIVATWPKITLQDFSPPAA